MTRTFKFSRPFMALFCLSLGLFILSGIWGPLACGESSPEDAAAKFHSAGVSYRAEDYKKAVATYEEILRSGWRSSAVYYNLANSYFKQGELGKAILNYERAKRLTPRDPDLISNYQYALSQRKNTQAVINEPLANRVINVYFDSFSFDEVSLMLLFFFFLAGVFYFLGLFLKWAPGTRLFWTALPCFLLFSQGFILAYKTGQQKNLCVILKDTPAKFEPLIDASVHFELNPGGKVKIIEQEGDWMKVKRLDGKIGWVKALEIEKIL